MRRRPKSRIRPVFVIYREAAPFRVCNGDEEAVVKGLPDVGDGDRLDIVMLEIKLDIELPGKVFGNESDVRDLLFQSG